MELYKRMVLKYTRMFFLFLLKLLLAIVLTTSIMVAINFIWKDSVINMISFMQVEIYKEMNTCENDIKSVKNGILKYEGIFIQDTDGMCYKEVINQADLLVVDDNYGGNQLTAEVISEGIIQHKVSVKVLNECHSACVDLLLAGNERIVCKGASVSIHRPRSDFESDIIDIYLKAKVIAQFNQIENKEINKERLKDILSFTPHEIVYEFTEKEMLDLGVATKIEQCESSTDGFKNIL